MIAAAQSARERASGCGEKGAGDSEGRGLGEPERDDGRRPRRTDPSAPPVAADAQACIAPASMQPKSGSYVHSSPLNLLD